MKYIKNLLLILIILTSTNLFAKEVAIDSNIKIEIPCPSGFRLLETDRQEINDLVATFTPPQNKALATFVTEDDAEAIETEGWPKFDRYILVQINKKVLSKKLTAKDFKSVKSSFKGVISRQFKEITTEANKLFDDAEKNLSAIANEKTHMEVLDSAYLGFNDETDNYLSFSALTKYALKTQSGSINETFVVAATTGICRVKDRLINFNVYSTYEGDSDIEWTKTQSKFLGNALVKANKGGSSASSNIFDGILPKIIIALVIAGVGGLVVHLSSRRN